MNVLKLSTIMITSLLITPALAQGRPDTRSMSCGQVQSLVQARGAVVLSTGPHRYSKYVKNHAYCSVGQRLFSAYVPTADHRRCKIGFQCKEKRRN